MCVGDIIRRGVICLPNNKSNRGLFRQAGSGGGHIIYLFKPFSITMSQPLDIT